jgi:hypothetical protein
MSVVADPKRDLLVLKPFTLEGRFQAFLLPVSRFPIPEQELFPIRRLLQQLTAALVKTWSLSLEVFIRFTQLHLEDGSARLSTYGREWIPSMGLGVWPDREPPTLWTVEELQNLMPDEKARPLMELFLRVTTSAESRNQARDVMLGLGCIMQVMNSGDTKKYLSTTGKLLLPPIKDRTYRGFPFYVPLLETKSIVGASADQLGSWFCGASAYIRESPEDGGILIAVAEPLGPILSSLGGSVGSGPQPEWRIPW